MGRAMKDMIVEKRLNSALIEGIIDGKMYQTIDDEYNGAVQTGLEPVKFDKAKFGLPKVGAVDVLERRYKEIQPESESCYVQLAPGARVPVEKEVLRVMKTLCVEQISCSPTYSRVLTMYFMHMVSTAAKMPDAMTTDEMSDAEKEIIQNVNQFAGRHVCEEYLLTFPDEISVEEEGPNLIAEDE